jgi:hypothetical protein
VDEVMGRDAPRGGEKPQNKISKLASVFRHFVFPRRGHDPSVSPSAHIDPSSFIPETTLEITRTCKQLNSEASFAYYSKNWFKFEHVYSRIELSPYFYIS